MNVVIVKSERLDVGLECLNELPFVMSVNYECNYVCNYYNN